MAKVKRPEWITCALTGYHNEIKTWCGRVPETSEFTFTDCSHAILNKVNKGRLTLCSECSDKIIETLKGKD